jgi:hypothetical protein
MSKCNAICKNGALCKKPARGADMLSYCCLHHKMYCWDGKLIIPKTVEPVSYDVVRKMPFPTDVSIKILNLADTKIYIDDKIKYKIPPSKVHIHPFFKDHINRIFSDKVGRRRIYNKVCYRQLSEEHQNVFDDLDPEDDQDLFRNRIMTELSKYDRMIAKYEIA